MTRIQIADIAPSESALFSDVTSEELNSINGGLLGGLLGGVYVGVSALAIVPVLGVVAAVEAVVVTY